MITGAKPFTMHTLPYEHQLAEFIKSRDREYYGLFWEMGTGKSKPLIDTAAHLYQGGEIDGVLIVSDKGSYLTWYNEEIEKHLHVDVPRRIAYHSSQARARDIRAMEPIFTAQDNMLDFLCVNVESLSSGKGREVCMKFLQSHYTLMIVDEATSIKNPKADRTKAAMYLGTLADYRRIATGTPITNSPLDLFGMCQFLKAGCLGFPSFVAFRSFYAEIITMSLGSRSFPKIVGYRNLDTLTKSIQPFSSRILKSECLDLPEKNYETIYVEMTPQQIQLYNDLKAMSLLSLEQGLLTSTSALTTLNKLQQICCGHVKLDDDTVVDIPNNRVTALLTLLETLDEKCVIWCAYQHDVETIMTALKGRAQYAVDYYGKTASAARVENLDNFHRDPTCRWFVGTAASGGKGINKLVGARYACYYSNTYVLEDRLQSEDRIHRIGQERNVTYFDLISNNTIDTKIVKALKGKKDLAHTVLDQFRELVEDDNLPF